MADISNLTPQEQLELLVVGGDEEISAQDMRDIVGSINAGSPTGDGPTGPTGPGGLNGPTGPTGIGGGGGGGAPFLGMRSGAKYGLVSTGGLGENTGTPSDKIDLFPALYFTEAVSFNEFTVRMESAAAGGSLGRVLIYDHAAGFPNNLLFQSASFPIDIITQQDITISPALALAAGVYYFGLHGDASLLSQRGGNVDKVLIMNPGLTDMGMNFDVQIFGVTKAATFGSPPNPFGAVNINTDLLFNVNRRPVLRLRVV